MASRAILDLVTNLKDNASKGLGGLVGGLAKLGLAAGGVTAIVSGARGLVEGLGDLASAAGAEKLENDQLIQSIRNSDKAFKGNADSLQAVIAWGEKKAFGDSAIRKALADLTDATGNEAVAQNRLSLAYNIARDRKMSLEQVTKILAKAEMGALGGLEKLGVAVDGETKLEDALTQLRIQSAGAADTYANSSVGAAERSAAAWENAREDIGSTLIPLQSMLQQGLVALLNGPEFQGAVAWLKDALSTQLPLAIAFLQEKFEQILPVIQPIIDFALQLATNFKTFLDTIGAGGDPLQAFVTLISDNLKAAVEKIGPMLQGALDWLVNEGLPLLGEQLGKWGAAFIEWVGPQIPPLLDELGKLAQGIWDWITTEALPKIVDTLAGWAGAFFKWVEDNDVIGKALSAVGTVLSGLASWIINDALPNIVNKLIEWGGAFFKWVADNDVIGKVVKALGDMLGGLIKWIAEDALPNIVKTLVGWATSFFDWVEKEKVVDKLVMEVGKLLIAAQTWIKDTLVPETVKALKGMAVAFLGWITDDVLPFIGTKLNELWTAISGWVDEKVKFATTALAVLGAAIVDGIKQGISDGWEAFTTWLGGLVGSLIDGVKAMLGISSPSDVMASEVGNPLVQGLLTGMKGAWSGLMAGARELIVQLQELFFRYVADGDTQYSILWWWRKAFNDAYAFLLGVWAPQIKELLKGSMITFGEVVDSGGQAMEGAWRGHLQTMLSDTTSYVDLMLAQMARLGGTAGGGAGFVPPAGGGGAAGSGQGGGDVGALTSSLRARGVR